MTSTGFCFGSRECVPQISQQGAGAILRNIISLSRRLSPLSGALLAAVTFLFPVSSRAQGPVVWTVPSLQRVGPSDPPGTTAQAQISAAKGESESYQIVVRAPASGLTNVNVTVSALSGPGGTMIPAANSTLYREQYLYVSPGSVNWNGTNQPLGPGWYADGLIPFVDPVTGASLYNSSAPLRAAPFNLGGNSNQPIWVDVLVPPAATAGVYAGTYTVTSDQGTASGTVSLTVWNFALPATPALKSSFAYWVDGNLNTDKELLRNRVMPVTASLSDQSALMPLGLGATSLGFSSGAKSGNCSMTPAPSVSQFQTAAAAQAPGLFLYDYSADEIGNCTNLYPSVQQWACNMHQAGVNNLVNDSYSPKWEIDFAPIDFRIQPGFINQVLGLTGLLYWRVDFWLNANPWTNLDNVGYFSTNDYPGDGTLVYPGSQIGISSVAPSIRLKWIRDGVDDYDYIQLLKNAGYGSWALGLAQGIAPDWTNWTRDSNALASVRQQLGQKLDRRGEPRGRRCAVQLQPERRRRMLGLLRSGEKHAVAGERRRNRLDQHSRGGKRDPGEQPVHSQWRLGGGLRQLRAGVLAADLQRVVCRFQECLPVRREPERLGQRLSADGYVVGAIARGRPRVCRTSPVEGGGAPAGLRAPISPRAGRAHAPRSKVKFQRHLRLAGVVAHRSHPSCGGSTDSGVRIAEVGGVEEVEELGAELQIAAFAKLLEVETLGHAHVHIREARAQEQAAAGIADGVQRRRSKGADVKPLVETPLGAAQHGIADHVGAGNRAAHAGIEIDAGCHREAALLRHDAVQFPATQEVGEGPGGEPVLADAEGKRVVERHREALRDAIGADAAVQVTVIQWVAIASRSASRWRST